MKEEEFLPETFSPDDIDKFARWKPQTKSGHRIKLLIMTPADTGLRLSEALDLRWQDVDLDNCLMTVLRRGRKERRVPFSLELRKILYRQMASGFVFQTRAGSKMSSRNCLRDVSLLCEQLHIKRPRRLLHAFRHSWASNAVRLGMNPFVLQRLLGHSTMAMTNKYVGLGTDDLQKGHVSLPV
jgi:integrase/recombinase XerD